MTMVALDTNVLLRLAESKHPLHSIALTAVEALRRRSRRVVIFPQILYEFWAVSTRSVAANGLGMTTVDADGLLEDFASRIPILHDHEDVFSCWRRLAKSHAVTGVNSHDMRIVAAMLTHGVPSLLTLNVRDFTKYSGIEVMTPTSLLVADAGDSEETT